MAFQLVPPWSVEAWSLDVVTTFGSKWDPMAHAEICCIRDAGPRTPTPTPFVTPHLLPAGFD